MTKMCCLNQDNSSFLCVRTHTDYRTVSSSLKLSSFEPTSWLSCLGCHELQPKPKTSDELKAAHADHVGRMATKTH